MHFQLSWPYRLAIPSHCAGGRLARMQHRIPLPSLLPSARSRLPSPFQTFENTLDSGTGERVEELGGVWGEKAWKAELVSESSGPVFPRTLRGRELGISERSPGGGKERGWGIFFGGSTHPAAASRSPRSPGAGRASLRRGPPGAAAHCGAFTAHPGALPARSLRTRARSPRTRAARPAGSRTLPQHRAVFLASLLLSPSFVIGAVDAGWGAGASLSLGRVRSISGWGGRGGGGGRRETLLRGGCYFSPLADEIAAGPRPARERS